MMLVKVLKINRVVYDLLSEFPECRDNDQLLILKVWAVEHPEIRSSDYSFFRFAVLFKQGEFANTESIRRSRQKVQEQHPQLRGKTYKARQAEKELMKEAMPRIQTGKITQTKMDL